MHALWVFVLLATLTVVPAHAQTGKTIVIGAEDDAAPWSYADGTGFVNELVAKAFAASGWSVSQRVVPYARCKAETISGQLAACFTASKAPDVEATLSFPVTPVIVVKPVMYVRLNSSVKSCDLNTWPTGVRLGLVRGYEYPPVLESARTSGLVPVQLLNSEPIALKMLAAGRIDVAVVNLDAIKKVEMLYIQGGIQGSEAAGLARVCDFGDQPGYLSFSRKHPDAEAALKAFEHGMDALRRRGEIARLQNAWARRALQIEKTRLGGGNTP